MKKQAWLMIRCLGLLLAASLIPAAAQASSRLVVNIPFQFTVGERRLPAGEYSVEQVAPAALLIRRTDGTASTITLSIAVQGRAASDEAKLVFHRYGDQYFLSQVWPSGEIFGRELWESQAEREMVKNEAAHEVALIARASR